MDEILTEQLEWLLSSQFQGTRLARCLLVLTGCLADDNLPDNIKQQMAALSRQAILQEVFDTLVASLNQFSKVVFPTAEKLASNPEARASGELCALIAQVEQARIALSSCEAVNYSEIVAWVVGQAKARKLWVKSRRR